MINVYFVKHFRNVRENYWMWFYQALSIHINFMLFLEYQVKNLEIAAALFPVSKAANWNKTFLTFLDFYLGRVIASFSEHYDERSIKGWKCGVR